MTDTGGAGVADGTPATTRDPSRPPVRVLLVGGLGRSGSTLLESVLGQVPGYVNVGEVVHLWERGLANDELVGDGDAFRASPFWSEVGSVAYGGWDALDPDEAMALQHAVDRQRHLPLMLRPQLRPAFAAAHDTYVERLERLYGAIATVADADVVVDASKHASHAFLLRSAPGVELRVVHLVRDPRGVAHSWSKTVVRPEVTSHVAHMERLGPTHASLRWTTTNAQFALLARLGVPTLRLRYEDLAADPLGVVEDVLGFAGHHPGREALPFSGARTVHLAPVPSLAGNPLRFAGGVRTTIRADRGWRDRLSPRDRGIVTALTWPLRRVYGYGTDGEVRDRRPAAPDSVAGTDLGGAA